MSVTVDVYTESLRTGTTDPQTWSHAGGTPQGVLVGAIHGTSATDHITAVSYGALALTRCQRNTDATTEPGAAEWWSSKVGDTIPTGTQTVSVTCGSTTDDILFCSITLNGARSLTPVYVDGIDGNAANPSVTMLYGLLSGMSFAAMYSGLSTHGSGVLAGGTGVTKLTADAQELAGNFTGAFFRQTTGGTADFAMAVTSATDDVAYACVVMAEYRLITDSCTAGLTEGSPGFSITPRPDDGAFTQPRAGRQQTGRRFGDFSRAGAETPIAASDTLAVVLAESLKSATSFTASESVSARASELAAVQVAVRAAETIAVTLTPESALIVSTLSISDSVAILASDTLVALAAVSLSDTSAVRATESASIAPFVPASESCSVALTEAATIVVVVAALDSVSIGLSETHRESVAFSIVDSVRAGASDTATLSATLSASESLKVVAIETASIAIPLAASESLLVGLTELATAEDTERIITKPRAGRMQTGRRYADFTRTDTGLVEFTVTESLAVRTTESHTAAVTARASDTLSVRLTEVFVFSRPDDGPFTQPLAGGEMQTGRRFGDFERGSAITVTATDTVAIHIAESISMASSILPAESLAARVSETTTASSTLSTAETLAVRLTESPALAISLSVSDQIAARSTESTAFSNTLFSSDTAKPLTDGLLTTAATVSALEQVHLGANEAPAIRASFAIAGETTVVRLSEAATASDITGGPTLVTSSDAVSVSLAESSTVSASVSALENVATIVQETQLVTVATSAAESTAVRSIETSVVSAAVVAQDTVAVSLTELKAISSALSALDSLHLGEAEAPAISLALLTSDTTRVQLAPDQATIQDMTGTVQIAVSDAAAAGLTELVTVQSVLSAADTASLLLDEAQALISSVLSASDALLCGFGEAAEMLGAIQTQDEGLIGLSEIANLSIPIGTSDTCLVALDESSIATKVAKNRTRNTAHTRLAGMSRRFQALPGSSMINEKTRW